jgi:hypothetical protein
MKNTTRRRLKGEHRRRRNAVNQLKAAGEKHQAAAKLQNKKSQRFIKYKSPVRGFVVIFF